MSPSRSTQATVNSYSAYKPVPPPKPLGGSGISGPSAPTSGGYTATGDVLLGQFLSEEKLAGARSTLQMHGGPPPPLSHILVTDQGHFHTHSTKFPTATDSEKLLSSLRYSGRLTEGIDNPALSHDTPAMVHYSSPHKLKPSYDGRSMAMDSANSSPLYARMSTFDTGEMHPYASTHGQHLTGNGQIIQRLPPTSIAVSGVHPISPEAYRRINQPNFRDPTTRHVSFQTQPTHESGHELTFNGISLVDDTADSNPNGYYVPQQLVNGGMKPNTTYVPSYLQSNFENQMNSRMNGAAAATPTQSPLKPSLPIKQVDQNGHLNPSLQNRTVNKYANEVNGESKKEDKWESFKRAGKKYSNFKNILSNKFIKADSKPNDQEVVAPSASKFTNSQGTNTTDSNKENPRPQNDDASNDGRLRGTQSTLNASFHKALRYSSLKEGDGQKNPGGMECRIEPNQVSSPHVLRHRQQQDLIIRNHQHQLGSSKEHHRTSMMDNLHRKTQVNEEEVFFTRKSGSCGQLAQEQKWKQEQEPVMPSWGHRSSENLSRALLSDRPYPEDEGGSGVSHPMPTVREARTSGGSDSGRGTGGSGADKDHKAHDTSLETSGSSTRNHLQGQSSGNESEWIDITESEIQKISLNPNFKRKGSEGFRREIEGIHSPGTPPLPLLSPESSPKVISKPSARSKKHSHSFSSSCNNHKPDLLETTDDPRKSTLSNQPSSQKASVGMNTKDGALRDNLHRSSSLLPSSTHGWPAKDKQSSSNKGKDRNSSSSKSTVRTIQKVPITESKQSSTHHMHSSSIPSYRSHPDLEDELTSTDAALDLNSVLDGATEDATSDDELTSNGDATDVYLIRKQLEGLEGMYTEVLKLLGNRKPHLRRRLHGSLSSLPSSITSSRIQTGGNRDRKGRVLDDRLKRIAKEPSYKSTHKRFQRLESHVVTLARSVAHLSSEMRTQHMMFQEMESIRSEIAALRTSVRGNIQSNASNNAPPTRNIQELSNPWNLAKMGHIGFSNPGRVKKLTQFFGDEPPLVRLFLRKLGYEKYAGIFEEEKIGMLELPYLTEERLQKIGIPLGPRIRILQEAQGPIKTEGNLSVYVV